MNMQVALETGDRADTWIRDHASNYPVPVGNRTTLSLACFDLALEHFTAVVALGRKPLYGSMLALARIQFEAFVRGAWFARCASEAQMQAFIERDRFPLSFEDAAAAVDKMTGSDGSPLADLHRGAWNAMCSYTHTGMAQLHRRFRGGVMTREYPLDDVGKGLGVCTALAGRTVIEVARIANHEPLMRGISDLLTILGIRNPR